MNKSTKSQSGKLVTTYTSTVARRDLDEVIEDILKSYKASQKITITIQ